ncbi:hypothetical protein N7488_010798, partial [Penicillium malachiteum]
MTNKLVDIGIDSLVGLKLVHDLDFKFECSLDIDMMTEGVTMEYVSPRTTPDSETSLSDIYQLSTKDSTSEPKLAASDVLDTCREAKKLTDQLITDFNCAGYMDNDNPKQTQLCISLTIDAFKKLGCNIRTAKPGDMLPPIHHAPQHERLMQYLYKMVESEGRSIDVHEAGFVRTAVSVPHKWSEQIMASLEAAFPEHSCANRLAYFCGAQLAYVLEGNLDG